MTDPKLPPFLYSPAGDSEILTLAIKRLDSEVSRFKIKADLNCRYHTIVLAVQSWGGQLSALLGLATTGAAALGLPVWCRVAIGVFSALVGAAIAGMTQQESQHDYGPRWGRIRKALEDIAHERALAVTRGGPYSGLSADDAGRRLLIRMKSHFDFAWNLPGSKEKAEI